jgi:endonuclease/exonuclease/phosphatase family metal-dependent hydrolase
MKVVSLNLWNGGRLFPAALDFLQAQQADLYFLQEAYDGHGDHLPDRFRTVDLLQRAFPNYNSYFAPVYLDVRPREGKIEDGQLLLSRWPLTDRENLFLDIPYGEYDQDATTDFTRFPATVQKAAIDLGERRITLLNVHGPVNFDGTADTDRRLKMRDIILSQLSEHSIIAGDFNVQPHTQTIRDLTTHLTDVFHHHQRVTSFNVKRKDLDQFPGYATAVVDMMLVTPTFKVVTTTLPEVDISDHLPLVAEIE